jgi:hypothetical protein
MIFSRIKQKVVEPVERTARVAFTALLVAVLAFVMAVFR